MTKEKLTDDEHTAVQRYATAHGRTWKSQLSLAWSNGDDEREADAGLLRSVRNRLGPRWLMRRCTIKPVIESDS